MNISGRSILAAGYQSRTFHPRYRADIDGMRAVAVLAVVLFHAFPFWIPGGFIGVDVFFVISGYLITTIILENLERAEFSFTWFYARRIKRIFPALMLVLGACLVFGWFALLADEYLQLAKHVIAGTGFISNFVLWNEVGYFDNAADTKPLLHLWSLGIEEQFYIIWPLFIWLAWRWKISFFVAMSLAGMVSFVLNVVEIRQDAIATFYSPVTRFWELLAGSLLAYAIIYRKIQPEKFSVVKSNIISVFGLLLIIGSAFLMAKKYPFPGWLAVPPVLGAVLLISAGSRSFVNSMVLSSRPAVWFGLISFPLYLWHWPMLSFARLVEGVSPATSIRLLLVLVSIVLAWLTWRFLERYIRFTEDKGTVPALLATALLMATLGAGVVVNEGLGQRSAVLDSGLTEQVRSQFMGPLWKYARNDACLSAYPFKNANQHVRWFCMKSDNAKPTLIILGNSFANQLYPGFVHNEALRHHSILSIGTCDFGQVEDYEGDAKNPCFGKKSTEQRQFIESVIDNNPSIKFAIIDGVRRKPNPAYVDMMQKRIADLESKGIKVILFTPHITPGFHLKACYTTPLRRTAKSCNFPSSDRSRLHNEFKPVLQSMVNKLPNLAVFEQNDIFCDGNQCSFLRNGMPLHRDEGHLSEYASIGLQHYFTQWALIEVPQLFDVSLGKQ